MIFFTVLVFYYFLCYFSFDSEFCWLYEGSFGYFIFSWVLIREGRIRSMMKLAD